MVVSCLPERGARLQSQALASDKAGGGAKGDREISNLDSPQPIDKAQFGRIKPSKSKDFGLVFLSIGLDWLGLIWRIA
jgi:hypothetical protein